VSIRSQVVAWEGREGEVLWRWRREVPGGAGEGGARGRLGGGNGRRGMVDCRLPLCLVGIIR
jgi:hypothetical protein